MFHTGLREDVEIFHFDHVMRNSEGRSLGVCSGVNSGSYPAFVVFYKANLLLLFLLLVSTMYWSNLLFSLQKDFD